MTTRDFNWIDHYPLAVTVCDATGTIIAMNRLAAEMFSKKGGKKLLGTSLFDCHPEPANQRIRRQLQTKEINSYIVEKKGSRKLVHQAPWFDADRFGGLVETIIPLPAELPAKE